MDANFGQFIPEMNLNLLVCLMEYKCWDVLGGKFLRNVTTDNYNKYAGFNKTSDSISTADSDDTKDPDNNDDDDDDIPLSY